MALPSFITPALPFRRHRAARLCCARPRMVAADVNLPPTLSKYIRTLSSVPDPKLRYQQLLFLAQKLPPMPSSLKTESNRVLGCTSVVHVHVTLHDNAVHLQGDSDAQLTKGLLALLVNGLDGATPQQIAAVDPAFIEASGLSVSLTPSRNNGFVNMLGKIKDAVKRLDEGGGEESGVEGSAETESVEVDGKPIYAAIVTKLRKLQPVALEVVDESYKHARHVAMQGVEGDETHFNVSVVADVFEQLSLVQRHRLIYTLLDDEMKGGVHALSIEALAPSEQ